MSALRWLGASVGAGASALLLFTSGACGSRLASVDAPPDAGDAGVEAGAFADATPTDAGPRTAGVPCIRDWPDYKAPTTPEPSLAGPRLALRGIEARKPGLLRGPSAYSGGKLGVTGGNRFWSFDLASGRWDSFDRASGTCQLLNAPTARPDVPGGFIVGCIGVLALEPAIADAGPSSLSIAWTKLLGSNVSTADETTRVSPMLVSPDGTLYFTATDGKMRALRARDGSEVWAQPLPFVNARLVEPTFGVGDRIFVGGKGYDRATGASVGVPRLDGEDVYLWGGSYGRRLVGTTEPHGSGFIRAVVLDECGNHRWSLPEAGPSRVVIGYNDTFILSTPQGSYVYSQEGDVLAGPGPVMSEVLALGADGVTYYPDCRSDQLLKLVALGPDLTVLDRLDVGGSCDVTDAVLLDDGQLLISRHAADGDGGFEVVRIATSSPGLAKTARPTRFHDNARTRWLSAW